MLDAIAVFLFDRLNALRVTAGDASSVVVIIRGRSMPSAPKPRGRPSLVLDE